MSHPKIDKKCTHDLDELLRQAGEDVYAEHVAFLPATCPLEAFLRLQALVLTCAGTIKILLDQLQPDDVSKVIGELDALIARSYWTRMKDKLMQSRKDLD